MHRQPTEMATEDRKLVFSGQYYEAWKAQLMSGLIAHDDMHELISAEPSAIEVQVLTLPAQSLTSEHHKYLRRQEGAKAYVFNRLTLPIIDMVRRCRTIREVLRKLDDEFRTCSYALESMARRNFYSIRYQDYNDMHQFLSKYQHYADCLADAGHRITEYEQMRQLIVALPKEYDVTVLNYHMYARDAGQSYQTLNVCYWMPTNETSTTSD